MATQSRSPAARAARAALGVLAVGHVAEAVALRRRARLFAALPALTPGAPVDGVAVIGAVDGATRQAVAAVMATEPVDVVDLVPGDLPADRALRLLRRLDPVRVQTDPLHTPGGAHEALALRPELAARMGDPSGDTADAAGGDPPSDRGDAVRRTVTAQRYAPTSAVVRVAPDLRARPTTPRDRWRELDELTAFARPHGALGPALLGVEAAHLLAMVAGLAVAPVAAAAALATWSAQPAIVFRSGAGAPAPAPALRPPGVGRASVLRLPRAVLDNLRTAGAALGAARLAARHRTPPPAAPPPERLFEEPRTSCPWCGSPSLVGRIDTTDLLQHKPGTFHLDECTACGHVFQNPALSLAGLDHYYDEFYEGEGAEPWEFAFAAMGGAYHRRTEALARFAEPSAWLDVGTGHGHFCLTARQRWPAARFDGLDLSASVEEAARRGWIDTAYRGLFPDLAGSLPRSYDVVSMHHYLEHTRDPRAELAAAAKALAPGGHLMIEGPDVDSPWSRRLGRYWRCWFQPQHQHFVTCDNLVAELEDLGFDVVSVERGPAGEGMDITSAVTFWVNATAPDPRSAWRPPPTLGARCKRMAVLAAAVPACAVAALVDLVKDAPLRRAGTQAPGNAYRVIARRR